MATYCEIAPGHPQHGPYHDREYGFPIRRDDRLLERLALEINQAGLSWLTILKKRKAFRKAFDGFTPDRVARYGARERRRLLADAGIVRNRLKVDAVIENARRVLELQEVPRLLRALARRPPSRESRRVDAALPRNLPLHGRRDCARVPRLDRLSPRRAPSPLSDLAESRPAQAGVDAAREAIRRALRRLRAAR